MQRTHSALLCAAALPMLFATGCGKLSTGSQTIEPDRLAMFKPLPDTLPVKAGGAEAERVALGRMLYYDTRLSRSQTISCNDCHKLDAYGVDNETTSEGFRRQRGERNSPTVYNAAARPVSRSRM